MESNNKINQKPKKRTEKEKDSSQKLRIIKKGRSKVSKKIVPSNEILGEEQKIENIEEGSLQEQLLEQIISGDSKLNKSKDEIPDPIPAGVEIAVSTDKMTVFMKFVEPKYGGEDISLDKVQLELEQKKIVYGVDEKKIQDAVESKKYGIVFEIAKGLEPVHGIDGKIIELKLRDTKQKVCTREDGTIDFKNLGAVNTIKEGERILKIIPPQEGSDGYNIFGVLLRAKPGKKPRAQKGENTKISDDGEYLVATCSGDLKYTRHGFSVSKIFVVNGNIDNTIGNIDFLGDVEIKGDIMEGYSVTAKGHVNIGGMVEGASVTSGGNITIKNGINGMGRGQLYAGGEIRCKFIENSTVISKGDIYAESIINSNVSTHESLYVSGRKGAMIGGCFTIQKTIDAKKVGAAANVPTVIILGAPPETIEKKRKLLEEFREINQKIKSIDKDIKYLLIVEENRGLTEDRKRRLSQLKMRAPLERLKAQRVQKVIDEIDEIMNNADKCRLTCNTIYPGCKINISNATLITKAVDNRCTFMYVEGEVKRL